jgi:excisionase family DNA binding protein
MEEKMDEFLTVEEVASTFKLSRRTILRLIYSKRIGAVKIGNRWRIPMKEIDILLHKQGRQEFLPFNENFILSKEKSKEVVKRTMSRGVKCSPAVSLDCSANFRMSSSKSRPIS